MPFKKGHNGMGGGRKKGKQNRRNLTDNHTTGKGTNNKNGTIDKFQMTKKWDTSYRGKVLDPELVDYYINNDLDVTELIDDLKEYNYDHAEYNREWLKRKKNKNANGN